MINRLSSRPFLLWYLRDQDHALLCCVWCLCVNVALTKFLRPFWCSCLIFRLLFHTQNRDALSDLLLRYNHCYRPDLRRKDDHNFQQKYVIYNGVYGSFDKEK